MIDRSNRGILRSIAQAGLLLLVLAVGAHFVWSLLAPLLPSLLAIFMIALLGYLLLGRRS